MKFIERMRELQEKATPGPWKKQKNTLAYVSSPECRVAQFGNALDKELKKFNGERWNADAALVASVVTALPAILDALGAASQVDFGCDEGQLQEKLRALDALVTEEK